MEIKTDDLYYIQDQLRHLAVPIDSLNPDPENARAHDKKNIDNIKSSLLEFGQDQPLVVQEEGRIIRKGNGRWFAAKEIGWTHVAAIIVSEPRIKSIRRALADNRTSETSDWNYTKLKELFTEFISIGEDITPLGWDEDEYKPFIEPELTPYSEEDIKHSHISSSRTRSGRSVRFSEGQWEDINALIEEVRSANPKFSDADCIIILLRDLK